MTVEYDWRDEAQILARCKKAVPNQGLLYIAAMCAKTHEYAIEYIEQAPVLVLGATYGVCKAPGNKLNPTQKVLIVNKFARLRGKRLKEAMAEFDLPYPLRKLRSTAITPNSAPVIFALRRVPPSVLSQSIPDKVSRQITWLSALRTAKARYEGRTHHPVPDDLWEWLVANVGDYLVGVNNYSGLAPEVGDLMDLAISRPPWNMRWTFVEARRAHAIWAASGARQDAEDKRAVLLSKYGVTETHEVDYSPLPNMPVPIQGMMFTPLRSVVALAEEGVTMKHCVATYSDQVLSGRSRIYSITFEGRNIATLELDGKPPYNTAQIKGPRNAGVDSAVHFGVMKFREQCLPDRKAMAWHILKERFKGGADLLYGGGLGGGKTAAMRQILDGE